MHDEECIDSQDLPGTAPIEDCKVDCPQLENFWGKLIQQMGHRHNTRVLTDECYRVGRAPSCEFMISGEDVGDDKFFSLISKVHFKLMRRTLEDRHVVYLEDLSSNGTFVNEKKVGKNQKTIIYNLSEISLALPHFKLYIFIDSTQNSFNDNWLPRELSDGFSVLKHLGSGGFGDVRLVIEKDSFHKYAMKKILKDRMSERRILNEVNILKMLKHPAIVNLEGIFDTSDAVFITLEYVPDGNLLARINQLRKIPEFECKVIFYQLLLAVEYLHNEGITHRDLKPENVLTYVGMERNSIRVKITDFGLSKIIDSHTNLKTTCGTKRYMAPEILCHYGPTYDNKVDIWSLGVMLFLCLSGEQPFSSEDPRTPLARQIMEGRYTMTKSGWHLISRAAIGLVKRMLIVDPLRRINIREIFTHSWLKDEMVKYRAESLMGLLPSSFESEDTSVEDLEPVLKKQRIACTAAT